MDLKLKASPLHTVTLRCVSRCSSPVVHTAQFEQHSPLRRVVNGISCCALAIATALLVGCSDIVPSGGSLSSSNGNIVPAGGSLSGGDILTGGNILTGPPPAPSPTPTPAPAPSPPPPAPPVVPTAQCGDGLAAQDLAGQCRAATPTMGALEASDGTSVVAMASVASLAVPQTVSRSLQVNWQPFGNDTAGYMVYFGNTADTANVLVSDLTTNSGLLDPSAPTVTYDSVRDLGLYAGDTVCFRIDAYDLARVLVGQVFLGCSAV